MKVTVNIECTPEEARQFFGLPDVRPMQDALMKRMETQMIEAADRFSPDGLLRTWLSLAPQGVETFERLFRAGIGAGKPSG